MSIQNVIIMSLVIISTVGIKQGLTIFLLICRLIFHSLVISEIAKPSWCKLIINSEVKIPLSEHDLWIKWQILIFVVPSSAEAKMFPLRNSIKWRKIVIIRGKLIWRRRIKRRWAVNSAILWQFLSSQSKMPFYIDFMKLAKVWIPLQPLATATGITDC